MNGIGDAVLALRWVQKWIGAFGGDPARVIVFTHVAPTVNHTTSVALHNWRVAANMDMMWVPLDHGE